MWPFDVFRGKKPSKKAPYEFTQEDMELSKNIRRARAQARLTEELAILAEARAKLAEAQADLADIQAESQPKDEMGDLMKIVGPLMAMGQQQNQNPNEPLTLGGPLPLPQTPSPSPPSGGNVVEQGVTLLPEAVKTAIRRGILGKKEYQKYASDIFDRVKGSDS